MTAPANVYPFSTADGKAIPLDIIRPMGLIIKTFTIASASFTIPTDAVVGVLYSTSPCVVRFGTDISLPVTDGAEIADAVLVPAEMAVTVALTAGTAYVHGLIESGTLYIQLIEQWAGLALSKQYSRK